MNNAVDRSRRADPFLLYRRQRLLIEIIGDDIVLMPVHIHGEVESHFSKSYQGNLHMFLFNPLSLFSRPRRLPLQKANRQPLSFTHQISNFPIHVPVPEERFPVGSHVAGVGPELLHLTRFQGSIVGNYSEFTHGEKRRAYRRRVE